MYIPLWPLSKDEEKKIVTVYCPYGWASAVFAGAVIGLTTPAVAAMAYWLSQGNINYTLGAGAMTLLFTTIVYGDNISVPTMVDDQG